MKKHLSNLFILISVLVAIVPSSILFIQIIKTFLVFLLFSLLGYVSYKIIFRDKRFNFLIQLGTSMILGPTVILFLLSILSYFFYGKIFLISFSILLLLALIFIVRKSKLLVIQNIKSNIFYSNAFKKNILLITIILFHIVLFFLFFRRSGTGGDVSQYWSLSNSFIRGNYPTVLPWQPDFLSVYHTGTFMVMGYIKAITDLSIKQIHFFFALYLMTSVLVFTTGIAYQKTKSVLALIPAVLGLIFIGGPIILIENGYKDLFELLKHFPVFDMTIGSSGIGATNTESLGYIIFIIFGLAIFLLFLFALLNRNTDGSYKSYVVLIVLTNLVLSVNETFLPIQIVLLGSAFVYDQRQKNARKIFKTALIAITIFVFLFFVIQNSVRDSWLMPNPDHPRFFLQFSNIANITNILRPLHENILNTTNNNSTSWYLVDLRILITVTLIIAIWIKNKLVIALSISSAICLLGSYIIQSTFSPWDNLRFFSLGYQLVLFSSGFLLVDAWHNKKTKIIVAITLLLISPQILSSYAKIYKISNTQNVDNYKKAGTLSDDLEQISKIVPRDGRLLVISFSKQGDLDHSLASEAVIQHGIHVPIGPSSVKILNIAAGSEWYDAISYLDPQSIDKLKIDYLYIQDISTQFLPQSSASKLKDNKYFSETKKTTNGTLFQISQDFRSLKDQDSPTIRRMLEKIENNKVVYLDKVYSDVRRFLFLDLAQKESKLYGESYKSLIGIDYYTTAEIIPPSINEDSRNTIADYAIMKPDSYPGTVLSGDYHLIDQTKLAWLWKNVK